MCNSSEESPSTDAVSDSQRWPKPEFWASFFIAFIEFGLFAFFFLWEDLTLETLAQVTVININSE